MFNHKLTWTSHVLDIEKSELCDQIRLVKMIEDPTNKGFAGLLLQSNFALCKVWLNLVGFLLWLGSIHSIERLHWRPSRIVFNFPKDMASCDVLGYDQWPSIFLYYKLDIFKLFHRAHINGLPELLSKDIYTKRYNDHHSLQGKHCVLIPRFCFMKHC